MHLKRMHYVAGPSDRVGARAQTKQLNSQKRKCDIHSLDRRIAQSETRGNSAPVEVKVLGKGKESRERLLAFLSAKRRTKEIQQGRRWATTDDENTGS